MVRKILDGNGILITNESNLTTNIKERDLINIKMNDYFNIIEDEEVEIVAVKKTFYINNMERTNLYFYDKFNFINFKISKGKTKKYLRIKLNEVGIFERNEIKDELLKLEKEVA